MRTIYENRIGSDKIKKTATLLGDCFDVGIFLFSQVVSNQVSSAPVSLTSVFGMGTGGPSPSSTPTIYRFFKMCIRDRWTAAVIF